MQYHVEDKDCISLLLLSLLFPAFNLYLGWAGQMVEVQTQYIKCSGPQ